MIRNHRIGSFITGLPLVIAGLLLAGCSETGMSRTAVQTEERPQAFTGQVQEPTYPQERGGTSTRWGLGGKTYHQYSGR